MKVSEEHFNPSTYMVIDRITGEEVNIHLFVERVKVNGWEKAWAKTIAEYMNICGAGAQNVLGYFLTHRNSKNLVIGTQRGIAKELEVSTKTVTNTMTAMQNKNFLKKINNGVWFVDPRMIRNGNNVQGVMLLRLWDETNG